MKETRNVWEYEIEPQPHPWAVGFWLPLAMALTLTIVMAPIGILIFAVIYRKIEEHKVWRDRRKNGEQA